MCQLPLPCDSRIAWMYLQYEKTNKQTKTGKWKNKGGKEIKHNQVVNSKVLSIKGTRSAGYLKVE